jgi:hypothetical protein
MRRAYSRQVRTKEAVDRVRVKLGKIKWVGGLNVKKKKENSSELESGKVFSFFVFLSTSPPIYSRSPPYSSLIISLSPINATRGITCVDFSIKSPRP